MEKLITILFLTFATVLLISFFITCAIAVDTISANQTITDGETIVSSGENFEMGFFSPVNTSNNRYVGIWYNKVSTRTVVWVANTETPLNNTSGVLRVSRGGLEILSGNNSLIWSSNSSGSDVVAQLSDTGNLVLMEQGSIIWQSFDYPGDTLLPGMRIGVDLITGKETHLRSWTSDDDPSAGQFVFRVDRNGYPQLFERQDVVPVSRFGPWNGVRFNGMPGLGENSIITQQFVFNESEIYYVYEYALVNDSIVSRMQLGPDGRIEYLNWINRTQTWNVYLAPKIDTCSRYGVCGPNGICNINNSPACSCLEGFVPRRPEQWDIADWSSGCERRTPLACGNGDAFLPLTGVKFPDTNRSLYNFSMTVGECEATCKTNCSCTAYANIDMRMNGSGCLLWFNDLMDIRVYDETQELHLKMAASEVPSPTAPERGSGKKKPTIAIVVSTLIGSALICLILALYMAWRKKKRSHSKTRQVSMQAHEEKNTNENSNNNTELSAFSLSMVAMATNNFALNNKLGEGGFGPVYKGVLEDGREIAVKRLSETSKQGLDEFKNEVGCIAKLQHRNLVKLLGYCIQGVERMLIYEYMANKSLDFFIFDTSRSVILDWPLRFRIINGIARGLLYLHQDSRLRIIHRDLKAGNILLDKDMNPKISDFGLARRFSGYETEANTNKVVGTYGYISPEYALHGLFSVKSDVYSFGILVLEIVSGKKNRAFSQQEHSDTLIGHAWKLHKDGKSLELLSSSLRESCVASQVQQAVHIGLLCVQHHAEDRPTMSSVVLMLSNENYLPPPKQPAFFAEENMPELNSMSSAPTLDSVDEVTITLLNAR